MSNTMNRIASDLQKIMSESDKKKTSGFDTQATVTRLDGDIAWVQFPGGEDETPVRRTTNAVVGDNVQVRVNGGRAWLLGNTTNPPTDDTVANVAMDNAKDANQNAAAAGAAAAQAIESAAIANDNARIASVAASQAQTDAGIAHTAANEAKADAAAANTAATQAKEDAAAASTAAGEAKADAAAANTAAIEAKADAAKANTAANDSLSQLGIVEDVVGTLNWITTHATYKATTDTEVHAGKWYFTKSGDTYNVVTNPTGNPSTKGYYEVDTIDEAVSNYVASHLALTDDGLYLTKDGNGYKILLANDGLKVYDPEGHLVSTFGESIIFDSARPQTIGNNNVYIKYYDKNNDGTPDSLAIKADEFLLSSGKTIQEELEGVENWFYSVAPTTSNPPASSWTTDKLKEQHLRDIYFDTASGKSYRWAKDGTTYKWVEIEDVELAALAKDLHDNYPPRSEFTVAPDKIQSTVSAAQTEATNAANTATDNKLKSYYTKTETDSQITQTANSITSTVSSTYETKTDASSKLNTAKTYAEGKASTAEANAKADTTEKLKSYYTKTETDSQITQTANSITSTVSSTYETKSDATSKLNTAKGYTDSEITSAKAEIKVTTDGISTEVSKKTDKDSIISTIRQSAETVKIKASQVEIDGTATFNAIKAKTDAAYDAKGAANTAVNIATSVGEQLVINGNGILGNDTNFTQLNFDGSVSKDSPGSFTSTAKATITSDYYFPIDTSKRYRFEFDARSKNGASTLYSFLDFLDSDKQSIQAAHHMYVANTLTTLAKELKAGDTKVYLTNAANYSTLGTGSHQRALIFWDYKNSFGYKYPQNTYSRYYLGAAWNNNSSIDKTNNVITLASAYSGPTHAKGTGVSQGMSGGNFKYAGINGQVVPKTWTHYIGYYEGVDYSGTNVQTEFPPATAYAKVGFLWNYNDVDDQTWVTNIQVYEDYKTDINDALTKANAAAPKTSAVAEEQYIYISKASGTTSVSGTTTWITEAGDKQNTWTTKRPTYNTSYPVLFVAKQKKVVSGTVTCTAPVKDDTTTIIDGGHITTGTIDSNRLNADTIKVNAANIQGSLTIGQLPSTVAETDDIPTKVSELTNDSKFQTDAQVSTAVANEANARKATYATSSTAAGTQAKVAACSNFALYTGATITVGFTNANTHATPTLNVNSTGAKTIKNYMGAALTAAEYKWAAGAALTFVYDGSYWRMQDSGATESKAAAAASASTASTKASEAATSASTASTKASEASTSASTASSKATAAANSASTASTKASEASTSASTASSKATAAANSATAAENAKNVALDTVTVKNTRNDNQPPSWYISNYPMKRVQEFKSTSKIGLSGDMYCWLQTDVPWADSSGGYPKQTVELNGKQYWRQGTSTSAWSAWVDAYGTAVESAKTATTYITDIDSKKGITVKPSNKTGNDFLQINSSAVSIYRNNVEATRIEDASARFGANANPHTTVNSTGLHVWKGAESTATNEVASFGSNARIGAKIASSSYLHLEPNKMSVFGTDDSNKETEIFVVGNLINQPVIDSFTGNGTQVSFELTVTFDSDSHPTLTVKVNNVTKTEGTDYTYHGYSYGSYIAFNTAPAVGAEITVSYIAATSAPYMTIGTRQASANVGSYSVAVGERNTASGMTARSEGYNTTASGTMSHAEGSHTTASGPISHAEGSLTTASGWYAHAEGFSTTASGWYAHAEGNETTATGWYSHTSGQQTIANGRSQTVIGEFNKTQGNYASRADTDYAFIIGNGTADDARSNAFAVKWNGDVESIGQRNTLHDNTGDVYLVAKRDDTNVGVGVGVGTGGANHGLYSFKTNKWIVYCASDGYAYTGTHLNPGTTSTSTSTGFYLGLDQHRWKQLYSYSAPNTKSDKKDKDIVGDLEYAKEFIMSLKPIEFQWKDSDHKRIHMGFIAQDVAEAGKKLDKDLSVYEAHYKDREDDYYGGEEVDDEKLSWSMMYSELIAPMVKVIQDQEERISKLETLVEQLLDK